MAHKEQIDFCLDVKKKYPGHFKNTTVLDAGSLDINGNNRHLFKNSVYVGIDIREGSNVDVVIPIHIFELEIYPWKFDTVICTEVLEHDSFQNKSLKSLYELTEIGGLLIITTASPKRVRHDWKGTDIGKPDFDDRDFYRAMSVPEIESILLPHSLFYEFKCYENLTSGDIYFYGIKRIT